MGSKSSSAPAPDPQLIAAQVRSMGIQDDVIQRIVGNSERMLPMQTEQMQFGLDTARQAWGQSQDDREWTLGRRGNLSGLQDRLVRDSQDFDESGRRDQMLGQTYGDITSAFSGARDQGLRSMARMGVNPSAGKMQAFNNQASIAQASAMAAAGQKVTQAARAEGFALTDRATNALAGYPAMGMQATGAGAGYGGMGLDTANKGLAGMNGGYGAAGSMAGQMGQNATSMYGAQAQYKLGSDRQAAESNPFASLLGAGAQVGAAWLGASDRRLKRNIVPVRTDARTGLTIYHFAYRDVPGFRWEGVMADEVLHVMPEAVVTGADGYYQVNYGMLGIEMKRVENV